MSFDFGLGLDKQIAQPLAMPQLPMVGAGSVVQGTAPSMWEQIQASIGGTPWATTTMPNGMKQQGMFDMGLGALQGGLGAYLGFQNLGIAKDTLAQNKRQFDLNFGAQQKTTNTRMADRQASRVAANPVAYSAVADYMAKNGI